MIIDIDIADKISALQSLSKGEDFEDVLERLRVALNLGPNATAVFEAALLRVRKPAFEVMKEVLKDFETARTKIDDFIEKYTEVINDEEDKGS